MVKSILDPPDPLKDETAFRKKLKALFDAFGWRTSHTYRARSPKGAWLTPADVGFPDLVCLRPPSLVFLECKSVGARKQDADQLIWIGGLQGCPGVGAWTVNPADWPELVKLARDGLEPLPTLGERAGQICYRVGGMPLFTPEFCKRDDCEGPHKEVYAERMESV